MEKFTKLTAIAAPMPLVNIDTDMILPKQFLKTIKRSGLGKAAFFDSRYDEDGKEIADFILNQDTYRNAKILITGDNFGCGSSREHAPWALLDFGIRCVISSSFGDIFYNNCFKNGILPVVVPPDELALLLEDANLGGNARMVVDLEGQQISTASGQKIDFDIDPFRKKCLLEGIDEIGLTMRTKMGDVDAYEEDRTAARPWA